MTPDQTVALAAFLQRAYVHSVGIDGACGDPAPDCVAAGFARADLEERSEQLKAVAGRCVVSTVQRAFLQRVLALMPPG